VDTSNYVNQENISIVLKNFLNETDKDKKNSKANEVMGRLRILKIFELDGLIMLLATILSQLQNKQLNFNLRMIVIDNLSALFGEAHHKKDQYF